MDTITATLSLQRWQGARGTYHLVTFTGGEAEALAGHALMHRLEFGRQRGFGSIKVTARIGDTEWRTSVFPQKANTQWVLLVSRKVMLAQGLCASDVIEVSLSL